MGLKGILGLTVIGAIVTTLGTLAGLVLKERVFARSFEVWKTRQSLDAVRRKYRDPVVLSALELCNRLEEICNDYPTDFLDSSLLALPLLQATKGAERDLYFKRYKAESSLYRICAFLGWLELYRQEQVFLDAADHPVSKPAEEAIRGLRADLADGHLNDAEDWASWTDALIFREEQRAIGEMMIVQVGTQRTVLGYAGFVKIMNGKDPDQRRWIGVAQNFLLDPSTRKDYRLTRFRRLLVHLVDLVEATESIRLQPHHIQSRLENRRTLGPHKY